MKKVYGDDWWSFTDFCHKLNELQVEDNKVDDNNSNNNQTSDIN